MSRHAYLLAGAFAASALFFPTLAPAQNVQEHVHSHGGQVMPFRLDQTVHIFRMTEWGGVQRVVMRDAKPGQARDPHQVHLIQEHLEHEAMQFQQGRFDDPATLHGAGMPGLAELRAGASKLKVSYRPLPDGAEIEFRARDIRTITAVHRWFGAQLSEHGADAKAE